MSDLGFVTLPDREQFSWFGNLLVETINSLKGTPLTQEPPWERKVDFHKQEFLKTFAILFNSISTLYDGIKMAGDNKADIVSAMPATETLVRACLENYALFHFIYVDNEDRDTVRFRFWSWYREGLLYRQEYKATEPSQEEKLVAELAEVRRIRDDLANNPNYLALTVKQQEKYDSKGTWHYHSNADLISRCGFSKNFAHIFYTHLCSFSHVSSTSQLQTSQADFATAQELSSVSVKPLFMTAGFYLRSFVKLFPSVAAKHTDKDKRFYSDWCRLGETFSANY